MAVIRGGGGGGGGGMGSGDEEEDFIKAVRLVLGCGSNFVPGREQQIKNGMFPWRMAIEVSRLRLRISLPVTVVLCRTST